jgi:hypothetical protein
VASNRRGAVGAHIGGVIGSGSSIT